MPLTFTFALSQNQTFELRCSYGTRRLDTEALARLINLCEEKYYTQDFDHPAELKKIGRELYQWLDGKEGWLRQGLEEDSEGRIYLDLIQTSEAQALNLQTQKVALGLAHLPWELLHNGSGFLLREANVLPVRSLHPRQGNIAVQNRPLRLLFMATSPEYPGIAPLGFEQEEANILEATKEQPLALVVEESGSVEELENLVRSYDENYFDVFHLTGHGVIYTGKAFGELLPKGQKIKDNTPCFITEDDLTRKASILQNMGTFKAQQGDIEEAIALYNQSLQINESINNVRGKAANLHGIARLKATQGDIEGAIALYYQSLQITDSINDVRGKAPTLFNLADLKEQQGDAATVKPPRIFYPPID